MKANETITCIREGDKDVITETYQQYRQEFIRWVIRKYARSDEEAREVYQEVFYRFLTAIRSGKLTYINSSIKTYLFGIGKNILSEQKRRSIRFDHEIDEEKVAENYEERLQKEEREQEFLLLESIFEQLDDQAQKLLRMVYYENRSMNEIAKELDYKNAASAKNQKYKYMEKIRKMLDRNKNKD
ncbi:MAG: sigma-70 family RNA polymerase sigma factor [Bacteroidota bacterium]